MIAKSRSESDIDLNDFLLRNPRNTIKKIIPLAVKYLLPSATHTSSEHLFSKAGNVLSTNRYCINHERASNAVICAAKPAIIDILADS